LLGAAARPAGRWLVHPDLAADERLSFLHQNALLYQGVTLEAAGLPLLAGVRYAAAAAVGAGAASAAGQTDPETGREVLLRLARIEEAFPGLVALSAPALLAQPRALPRTRPHASLRLAAARLAYRQRDLEALQLLARDDSRGGAASARVCLLAALLAIAQRDAGRTAVESNLAEALARAPAGSTELLGIKLTEARWLYGLGDLLAAHRAYAELQQEKSSRWAALQEKEHRREAAPAGCAAASAEKECGTTGWSFTAHGWVDPCPTAALSCAGANLRHQP